ncbi:MAG: hypothetical protein M3347_15945 [Armatimonadota bacterium]|nr:hypothetical protein [Armatimonadota bacterium]
MDAQIVRIGSTPVELFEWESTMKQKKVKTPLLRYPISLSSGIVGFLPMGFAGILSVLSGAFSAEASPQKAPQPAAAPKTSIKAVPTHAPKLPAEPVEPVYSVVSPLGNSTVKKSAMAPRLNTLEGKTVGMVWNHSFRADITFPAMEASLKQQYPGIKIIPYTEFDAAIRAAGDRISSPQAKTIQTMLKKKYCDAVISGNGG